MEPELSLLSPPATPPLELTKVSPKKISQQNYNKIAVYQANVSKIKSQLHNISIT